MRKKWIGLLLAVVLTVTVLAGCAGVKMTLTFEVDGEAYATVDTMGQETVTMPKDPEKEGYTFDGWYWDKDVWEKPFTVNSLLETPLTQSMTVYAKWKRIETETETPTYHTVTFKNGDKIIETQQVESGKAATVPMETPTKAADEMYSAYTFTGWDKTFDNVTSDITVNAVFEGTLRVFTVTFKNGAEVFATQEVEYGKSANAPEAIPTKESTAQYVYTFTGWDDSLENVISDRTLNARFTETVRKYTVTFINGTEVFTTQIVEYGKSVAAPTETPTSQIANEKFTKWYSDSACTTAYSFDSLVTNDITLYAGYTVNIVSDLNYVLLSNDTYEVSGLKNQTSTEVVVPETYQGKNVTSIGDWAFGYCSNLTSIEIPNSVTNIGSRAFEYCSSLKSVVIGNSVTSIGSYSFRYCSSLTSIEYIGTKAEWKAIDKGPWWNSSAGNYTVKCSDVTLSKAES